MARTMDDRVGVDEWARHGFMSPLWAVVFLGLVVFWATIAVVLFQMT